MGALKGTWRIDMMTDWEKWKHNWTILLMLAINRRQRRPKLHLVLPERFQKNFLRTVQS